MHSGSFPKRLQQSRLTQAQARSQELLEGLACWWQEPKHLGLLRAASQMHQQEARSEGWSGQNSLQYGMQTSKAMASPAGPYTLPFD